MPNAISLVLKKSHPTDSWGVGLVKEGVMCVVGKVNPLVPKQLLCGDLILFGCNERDHEAYSPTCGAMSMHNMHPSEKQQQGQDWYRAIVDLFRTSDELHLIVQRCV